MIRRREGFALVSVLLAMLVLVVLSAALVATTMNETVSSRAVMSRSSGFYAAEAGLNIRGELVRATFQGFQRPAGSNPTGTSPCSSGNQGSGDFRCMEFDFNNRTVMTYVSEDPRNNDPDDSDRMITIPPGERFAGLNAIQYRYHVISEASPSYQDAPEAMLEMVFRTRLVPLFQFAAFYDKDLEILPGQNMTLSGPVHVNGDLYLNGLLEVLGEISVARRDGGGGGELWRGRKDANACDGNVRVDDADGNTNPNPEITCPRGPKDQDELNTWNGRIEVDLDALHVPPRAAFEPGGEYWRAADLVVALDVRSADPTEWRLIVPDRTFTGGHAGITVNEVLTQILNESAACAAGFLPDQRTYDALPEAHPGSAGSPDFPELSDTGTRAVEWSNSFRDRRENQGNAGARNARRVLVEVNVRELMNCLHREPDLFNDGPSSERRLDDTSSGGLVWYFTVLGPHSDDPSSGYGVRLRDGAVLGADPVQPAPWDVNPPPPEIMGLTVISDQSVLIQGDYNLDANWRPAAVMADAVHLLSNGHAATWEDHWSARQQATPTTFNSAFLSGTQTTGNAEGGGGRGGAYNGGLENYPTMHETWGGGVTLRYRGSFVSLDRPLRSNGPWNHGGHYTAPQRDWGYDNRFNDVANLPPLAPRFVYLLQERFVREYSR